MPDVKTYTLPDAARLAGVSEDELRCAIKDGLLAGTLLQNVGTYQIRHDDLVRYLKRRGGSPGDSATHRRRRVLIIDDEGKDGVRMAKEFLPDLCLIDFILPDISGEEVLAAIREVNELKETKVLVYSAHTRDAIREDPKLERRLQAMGAPDFVSKTGGMRPLIVHVYGMLGLDTQTKIFRRKST
ncbi:MAG: response regulator [Planctomycetota bacterium]|jgi:CheY-like chemotaxis protein